MIEDEELRELYKTASAEHLALLEQGLLHLEKHPDSEERLAEVLRSAHTLKGDSRMLGVSEVETLTHQMEQVLGKLREDQNALQGGMSDRLYQALDAISKLVSEAVTGVPSGVNTPDVLAQLMGVPQWSPVEQEETTLPQQQVHSGNKRNLFIKDSARRERYKTASAEQLQKLEAGLLHLEKHPDDSEILEEVLRSVHTLKADSRMLGVQAVETIAHQMEQILGKLRSDQNALQGGMGDRLKRALDAIASLVSEAVRGLPSGVNTAEVLAQLMEVQQSSPVEQPEITLPQQPQQHHSGELSNIFIEDDELREIYNSSASEHLRQIEAGLLHLEKHPSDSERLEEVLRSAHSLKGDSRMLGVLSVESIAHQMEQVLAKLKSDDRALQSGMGDRLYQALDGIRKLVSEAVTGSPSGVNTEYLLAQLMPAEQSSPVEQPEITLPIQQVHSGEVSNIFIEDDELREIYNTSASEHLQKLEAGLLHLEKHPDDRERLEEVLRSAHSLKGDSRMLGVLSVESIAHQMEQVLAKLKSDDRALQSGMGDRLYQALDGIRKLVSEAVTGSPSGVNTEYLLAQLMPAEQSSPVWEPEINLPQQQVHSGEKTNIFIEDDELREIYNTSASEHLQKLEAGLLHLEKHPSDSERLEEVLRSAHSLKGDSRMLGVLSVESIAHEMEQVLAKLKSDDRALQGEMGDRLYQALDAIRKLVSEAVTGSPSGVKTAEVLAQLMPAEQSSPVSEPEINLPIQQVHSGEVSKIFIEDDELREIYNTSASEHLQKLEAGLLHLEKHPDDRERLEEVLRSAHSIKGDSRMLGVKDVETLAHQIEHVLGKLNSDRNALQQGMGDRLYQAVDAMGKLVSEAVTGGVSGVKTLLVLAQLMGAQPTDTTVPQQQSTPQQQVSKSEEKTTLPQQQSPEVASPIPHSQPEAGIKNYRIESVRVGTRDLDALMTQAGELTVSKIRMGTHLEQIEEIVTLWEEWSRQINANKFAVDGAVRENFQQGNEEYLERLGSLANQLRTRVSEDVARLEAIASELDSGIRTLRLLPLSTIFHLFPRVVRDLSRQQGKQVELVIAGGETQADKRILEEMKDPLMHMIRNSVDHGIETPAERQRQGKPPAATIQLRGYQTGNSIIIEIADDGRGLDLEKIKQTALRRGNWSQAELEAMTPQQIQSLIFAAGFSTRKTVTEISGRGVGLDVVRANIEKLKGSIEIESTKGKGCSFRIKLSTTLATAPVLIAAVDGIPYALPVEFVQTTLTIHEYEIFTIEGRDTYAIDGEPVSLARLTDLLELGNGSSCIQKEEDEQMPCIIIKVGQDRLGLLVDDLLDEQDAILKPQSKLLKRVRNVTGATILSTGEVCIVLNPQDLLKSVQKRRVSIRKAPIAAVVEEKKSKPIILVADDSIAIRTQEKRILEAAGYEVVTAVDGLDAYNKLRTRDFDAVVSDVQMPNLDGLSLAARIRQHKEYNELPIVLVTSLASDSDKRRGAEAGANAYIPKGTFSQEELVETLRRLV